MHQDTVIDMSGSDGDGHQEERLARIEERLDELVELLRERERQDQWPVDGALSFLLGALCRPVLDAGHSLLRGRPDLKAVTYVATMWGLAAYVNVGIWGPPAVAAGMLAALGTSVTGRAIYDRWLRRGKDKFFFFLKLITVFYTSPI